MPTQRRKEKSVGERASVWGGVGGWARGEREREREGETDRPLAPWTFLCSIFVGYSLPCLFATTILDSCSLS